MRDNIPVVLGDSAGTSKRYFDWLCYLSLGLAEGQYTDYQICHYQLLNCSTRPVPGRLYNWSSALQRLASSENYGCS